MLHPQAIERTRNTNVSMHTQKLSILALVAGSAALLGGCASSSGSEGVQTIDAQRVEVSYLRRNELPGQEGLVGNLFGYVDPEDPERYYNVFRFGGDRVIALGLIAQSENGNYDGDTFFVLDVTNPGNIQGWTRHAIGEFRENVIGNGFGYTLYFQPDGYDNLAIVRDSQGFTASVSVNMLYRLRIRNPVGMVVAVGDRSFHVVPQGGARGGFLFFPERALVSSDDPQASPTDLTPRYVVWTVKGGGGASVYLGEAPIGDSGYVFCVDEDTGGYVVKKTE